MALSLQPLGDAPACIEPTLVGRWETTESSSEIVLCEIVGLCRVVLPVSGVPWDHGSTSGVVWKE